MKEISELTSMKGHENTKETSETQKQDLSLTLASLIANRGVDLEITRKVKKLGNSTRNCIHDKHEIANMIPIYKFNT